MKMNSIADTIETVDTTIENNTPSIPENISQVLVGVGIGVAATIATSVGIKAGAGAVRYIRRKLAERKINKIISEAEAEVDAKAKKQTETF